MKKIYRLGLSAAAATVAFGLIAVTANAQTAAPAPAAPAAKTAPPAATPAAKAPAAAKPAAKPAAAPSPCKGLEETAGKANSACGWTVRTKANAKTGKV